MRLGFVKNFPHTTFEREKKTDFFKVYFWMAYFVWNYAQNTHVLVFSGKFLPECYAKIEYPNTYGQPSMFLFFFF